MISVVKSDAQYKDVLHRIEQLMADDPTVDSAEGRELEVLAILVREYERAVFPLAAPSPLGALALRMDQLGLAPKDLVPYLGSRSKVSEVLAGKRPLSLTMIPIREMVRRGWMAASSFANARKISFAESRDAMEAFFRPIGGPIVATGVLHKTDCVRTARSSDRFALAAWAGQVLRRAEILKPRGEFTLADWDVERFRELRGLSRYDVGPRLAVQFLSDHGIVVVVEPHLKRTRLDGAAMLRTDRSSA